MAELFKHLLVGGCLLLSFGCDNNNSNGLVPPSEPPWIRLEVKFESLPDVQKSAALIFNVTYVGDDGDPLVSLDGDTLKYMWLSFVTDQKVEILGAKEDSIWHGKIEIGEKIKLEHNFQLIDEINDHCCKSDSSFWACHFIALKARFFVNEVKYEEIQNTKSHTETSSTIWFNHLSKKFNLDDPYDNWIKSK